MQAIIYSIDKQQDPTVQDRELVSIQYLVIKHNGKEHGKECLCIYIYMSLCCIVEINTF